MNLADLHAQESLRQQEFPVTQRSAYFAHAGVCPLPSRVTNAITRYLTDCTQQDQEDALPPSFFPHLRSLAAQLLQAQPQEIALVGPTSLALSFLANGLPLHPGDNILVYLDDYPTNVYPWMKWAERGVEVRRLHVRELGRIEPADLEPHLDARTRLVALASAHFVSGWRLDVSAIGQLLHSRGILFSLDAIQTLGAFPTTVEHVDFLAADAHKWLLGPCAAGILYVRQSLQDQLAPSAFGWHNVRCPNFVTQEQLVLQPDARRYEAGTANLAGLAGLLAALELIHDIGLPHITADLVRKRQRLVSALQAHDYTVLHPHPPAPNTSGITTFRHPRIDATELHHRLAQAGVTASLRTDRAGTRYVRFSPHFYNTDAELERALECLQSRA